MDNDCWFRKGGLAENGGVLDWSEMWGSVGLASKVVELNMGLREHCLKRLEGVGGKVSRDQRVTKGHFSFRFTLYGRVGQA
jgi:hypothetical protein